MNRYFAFLLLTSLFLIFIGCSVIPRKSIVTFSESQVKGDTIIYFRSTQEKPNKIIDSLTYYWTKSGRVFETQGYFLGRVLHNEYVETVNGEIVCAGTFKYGLKDGIWKKWEGSRLTNVVYWNNGAQTTKSKSKKRNTNGSED